MKRFIEGEDRGQGTLLSELLDDYVAEDNPVRVVDFVVEGHCQVVEPTRRVSDSRMKWPRPE
jgi:hypothetical protein